MIGSLAAIILWAAVAYFDSYMGGINSVIVSIILIAFIQIFKQYS